MRIVAIVPAFNESSTIANVVSVLRTSSAFTDVIVIDDGSTDETRRVATDAGARVFSRPNGGKGSAMLMGVRATQSEAVAFFDADLVGLLTAHVQALVHPVNIGRAVMTCGLRDYGPAYNALQRGMPAITGERVVLRRVLERVPPYFWDGFRTEAGINAAARLIGPVETVVLEGLTMRPKWQKVAPSKGIVDAAKMMREVIIAMATARQIR